jgi:SAM-dependent methyltransferase
MADVELDAPGPETITQRPGPDSEAARSALRENPDLWYHTIELAPGIVTPGYIDMRGAAPKVLPDDLGGKRALDIGTFDGFWAFELEKRGAAVTTADLERIEDADWPPAHRPRLEAKAREDGLVLGRSFRLAKEALRSDVERVVCNVYDLSSERVGGPFDFVYVGAILIHLRDPISALERIRSVLVPGGEMRLFEPFSAHMTLRARDRPAAEFKATRTDYTWWLPNTAGFTEWVTAAGFADVERVAFARPPCAERTWYLALRARRSDSAGSASAPLRSAAVAPVDMREFWDARAREDPYYFIDNTGRYREADLERFWANGARDLDRMLEAVGGTIEPSDSVVEIGCGVGRMTRVLAERSAHVCALDVSEEMIERARELNPHLENVEWLVGDGRSLAGIPDQSATVAHSFVVFQHIPDPEITLGYVHEIGRVLKPGGWAFFQISNDPEIHRRRPALARFRHWLKALVGRAPRGQSNPAWRGCTIELERLRSVAAEAGMTVERVVGEGTQFCFVRVRKEGAQPHPAG